VIFGVGAFANLRSHYKRKSIENIDAQTRLVYWGCNSFDGNSCRPKRPGEFPDLKRGVSGLLVKTIFFNYFSAKVERSWLIWVVILNRFWFTILVWWFQALEATLNCSRDVFYELSMGRELV